MQKGCLSFDDSYITVLYNYWDKIGDFIAAHFPNDISPERVFFSNTIDIAKKHFPESVFLEWLTNFRDNDYKAVNNMRKKAVHYSGTDVDFRWQHIQNFSNKDELEKSQKQYFIDYKKVIKDSYGIEINYI